MFSENQFQRIISYAMHSQHIRRIQNNFLQEHINIYTGLDPFHSHQIDDFSIPLHMEKREIDLFRLSKDQTDFTH